MKLILYASAFIGGIVGGYLPVLWGGGLFDVTSILLGTLGTVFGIFIGYKISKYLQID